MTTNPASKKIVQFYEESFPPVNVPFFIGNVYYNVIQQDMRKIEDTRLLNFVKCNANGESIPIEPREVEYLLQLLQMNNKNVNYQNCAQSNACETVPMEISNCSSNQRTVATLKELLKWDKCSYSVPFPFSYSRGTSTTELDNSIVSKTKEQHACCCNSQSGAKAPTSKLRFSTGTNTSSSNLNTLQLDAREQQKLRKSALPYYFN